MEDEEAPFPDVRAELTGVPREENDNQLEVVTNEPEPDFDPLVAAALDNAGNDTGGQLGTARAAAAVSRAVSGPGFPNQSQLIEAKPDKILFDITFELPNVGLLLDQDKTVAAENAATILPNEPDKTTSPP